MKTNISRRDLYAFGEPFGDNATTNKVGGGRIYGMGGGGSGAPNQTTSTSYNTNVPEYARPYVETMLGATQKQLFEGNPTGDGGFNITGFKPYQPYSTNPSDYVAGFSPMQQQSQQTVANMQVPGQYQAAADITGAGIMGAADVGAQARAFNPMAQQAAGMGQQYQQMATDPNAISAYMSPYMQNVVDTQQREAVRQSDIQRTANMGQATQQGAFGGGRQAIMEAERQRNLGTQLGGIQAQGSQNAFQSAQQAQQYGANLGLQGLQTGAGIYGQGLTAQQQAIQQALGGAGQLAGLGGQALEAQKGIANLQNQYGAQQQSMEQQKINQAIQDYSNAQQYPLMQLGTMSNMLRGLPMQAQTTNQYVAAPNQLTQGIGAVGAGASMYNAFNPSTGRAPGMAKGGIASVPQYDVGGEVESDLEGMSNDALAREAKESPSPIIRQKAQRILRERQMEQAPQSAAPQGIQYQAPQAPQGMAGGGIIAFKTGDIVYGGPSSEKGEGDAVGFDAAGRTMAERLAMPPAGIVGAVTPAPAAPAPYVPQAGRAMQYATDIPDYMKAQYADAENLRAKSIKDIMAENKAAYAAEGVVDVSEGQQMQRAEMMAEKANLGAEKERQKNLRLAEFFASWGSTPGPTLVAGMNALQKTVPNIVADEKEQKKIRREIDKSIAELDNATRLEKRGEVDKATAIKLKNADAMKALSDKLIDYQSRRESDKAGIRGQEISAAASNYRAELQLRGDELRATQSRLDRAAMRETADDNKRFGQYQTASGFEQRLISKIADQAKLLNPEYETIKIAEMNAKQNDGKMTPSLVPGYEAAKKKIEAQEKIWNEQKESAAKDTELAYSRVRLNPEAAAAVKKDKPTPTPTPAATAVPLVSGEFPAPTAAHISALKANPAQKAAFNAKFGPGAASEYLGK